MPLFDEHGDIISQDISRPQLIVGPSAAAKVDPHRSNSFGPRACHVKIVDRYATLVTITAADPETLRTLLSDALAQVDQIIDQSRRATEDQTEDQTDDIGDTTSISGVPEDPEARVERSIQRDLRARNFLSASS